MRRTKAAYSIVKSEILFALSVQYALDIEEKRSGTGIHAYDSDIVAIYDCRSYHHGAGWINEWEMKDFEGMHFFD